VAEGGTGGTAAQRHGPRRNYLKIFTCSTTENAMQRDHTCSTNTETRIRGRWAPGVSGNARGRPRPPAWMRIDAQRNIYVKGILDDRNNRLPGITAQLVAALEARCIEIEAGSAWPPVRTGELERVEALLNAIKFEEFA
jgi:hypothetical protein